MIFSYSESLIVKLRYKPYTKGENKGSCPLNFKRLNNCSFEFTLTETCAGGTFLCIANHLSYKRNA